MDLNAELAKLRTDFLSAANQKQAEGILKQAFDLAAEHRRQYAWTENALREYAHFAHTVYGWGENPERLEMLHVAMVAIFKKMGKF